MRPVDQTTFGGADAPPAERGDCFSACLASLMHLEIERVPRFCELPAYQWDYAINCWLVGFGKYFLDCRVDGSPVGDQIPVFGYHVLSGESSPGHRHSVVALGETIAFDPHPSGAGLLPHPHRWTRGFLIDLDPRWVPR